MAATCPYCNSDYTKVYYSIDLPIYTWPLLPGEKNLIAPVEISLCSNCWYAFNSKPLPEKSLQQIYDNYFYVSPSMGIGHSLRNGFIQMVKGNTRKEDRIIEIGSSDGYLLRQLHDCGYINLGGIDPNPRINEAFPVKIMKGYFTRDTNFESEIDVFLLEHVFEHLEKPWEFLKKMSDKLSNNGRILMEFPGYCNGMHHQHLSFFTLPFLQNIAIQSGLNSIPVYHEEVTRIIFKKNSNPVPLLSNLQLDEEKKKILAKFNKVAEEHAKMKSELVAFLEKSKGDKVYWWGTGSWATILFYSIDKNILGNMDLEIIDSDPARTSRIFSPANKEVKLAESSLSGKNVKNIVLGSQFISEMRQKLEDWNCRPERIFPPLKKREGLQTCLPIYL